MLKRHAIPCVIGAVAGVGFAAVWFLMTGNTNAPTWAVIGMFVLAGFVADVVTDVVQLRPDRPGGGQHRKTDAP